MTVRRLLLLTPLALAACQSPGGSASAVSTDQTAIVAAVAADYQARYSPDACVAPVTLGRKGPEDIPHDLANRAVTWTRLARGGGTFQPLDASTSKAIDDVWQALHTGDYPSITLPAASLPPKPAGGCGKTLTLTSPMIAGTNAFVRWSDGTDRRTVALRKNADGWAVVAEGPARIG